MTYMNESIIIFASITALCIFYLSMMKNIQTKSERWSCVEGKCEFDINGKYQSESECKNSCANKE